MQCKQIRELLSPYLDAELGGEEMRAVAQHLESCRSCAALAEDLRRIGRRIAVVGREPPPNGLKERVAANLASAAGSHTGDNLPAPWMPSSLSRHTARHAAVTLMVAAIASLATWWIVASSDQESRLAEDVLSAHVRSLLQDSTIAVASTDPHTVKPWFTGRLDFAPEVKDLAAQGFPLVGGRLDFVGGRRVGALVYKRRQHTISVFVWPSDGHEHAAPRHITRNGYNLLLWTRDGMTLSAISDLNAGELRELQSLL